MVVTTHMTNAEVSVRRRKANPSPEHMQATIRRLAVKHRRSLEILEAYDKGEIERPRVRACQPVRA
jgi:hypothetical protein